MGSVYSTNGQKRNAYRLLVGKSEKESVRKPKAYVGQ
jgi:hypothetical protein